MIPRVYLADLRHDYSGVLAIDTMPLGVSYMKAVIDRDLPNVQARVFAYPDRLLTSIRETPPAVLMLTNYAWNEALSLHVAQVAKAIRPGTLVVMGGPNVPLEDERRIAFVAEHRALDVYILGEGDFQAAEIVRRFLDAGTSIARFAAGEIPSSVYRRPDGTVTLQAVSPRHRRIDDIPSPWLTGIQDEFFDVRLAPMLQTNRGCPFTCTFCVEGTSWYTKVHNLWRYG